METHVRKWGNSLALRIPRSLAEEAGLYENAPVALALEEGKLVVMPLPEPAYVLEILLAQVTPENLHGEVDSGEAVGGEVW